LAIKINLANIVVVSDGSIVRGSIVRGSIVRGSVVRGSVVRGSVVRGSVVRGSVVRGSVVRGSVVRGGVVRGGVVRGGVVRGDVIHGCGVLVVFVVLAESLIVVIPWLEREGRDKGREKKKRSDDGELHDDDFLLQYFVNDVSLMTCERLFLRSTEKKGKEEGRKRRKQSWLKT